MSGLLTYGAVKISGAIEEKLKISFGS